MVTSVWSPCVCKTVKIMLNIRCPQQAALITGVVTISAVALGGLAESGAQQRASDAPHAFRDGGSATGRGPAAAVQGAVGCRLRAAGGEHLVQLTHHRLAAQREVDRGHRLAARYSRCRVVQCSPLQASAAAMRRQARGRNERRDGAVRGCAWGGGARLGGRHRRDGAKRIQRLGVGVRRPLVHERGGADVVPRLLLLSSRRLAARRGLLSCRRRGGSCGCRRRQLLERRTHRLPQPRRDRGSLIAPIVARSQRKVEAVCRRTNRLPHVASRQEGAAGHIRLRCVERSATRRRGPPVSAWPKG
mmetsp:Transcript_44343/g.113221  ORF Transcript_44343/g.113221 Transcript_44343/m.113221 type:complete len:303 (-) Transcript_44343:1067-1975(-)